MNTLSPYPRVRHDGDGQVSLHYTSHSIFLAWQVDHYIIVKTVGQFKPKAAKRWARDVAQLGDLEKL